MTSSRFAPPIWHEQVENHDVRGSASTGSLQYSWIQPPIRRENERVDFGELVFGHMAAAVLLVVLACIMWFSQ